MLRRRRLWVPFMIVLLALTAVTITGSNVVDQPAYLAVSWERMGGPPGGLGYDIRYNFDDPDIWYVTDAHSGFHISTDRGLTWTQSNDGIERRFGTVYV